MDAAIAKGFPDPREHTSALLRRGKAKKSLADFKGAINDYTAVIELEGAPRDLVALALVNRGVVKGRQGDSQGALADYTAVIELEGAPKDEVARALFNSGFTKDLQGDSQGALADYTTVIELEGAPKDEVARALVNRGIAKGQQGDSERELADYMAAIDLGVTTGGNLMLDAAHAALAASWRRNDQNAARMVMEKFSFALGKIVKESAIEISLGFLRTLASPEMKDGWPFAWRILAVRAQPEVAEALGILEPVCDVLSSKDRSLLNALPPEQREFVQLVLTRFETER